VEDQLAAMYHPVVQLKSGGYLVINPTEALVSIDINSGRSTREHNIEQTATATNLEAAREIARQLRLRDMAGLVVIDFIDMEHGSNVRKVEKAMKEALKDDRARIQVGRISGFGLMEMSRQRLRTGVLEASTRACPHCEGTGLVRTASSAGLSALRMLEEEAARGRGSVITLRASQEAAFYVLNNKRRELDEIEQRYGVSIVILPDGEVEGARMSVEASGPRPTVQINYAPVADDEDADLPVEDMDEEEEDAHDEPRTERQDREDGEGGRRRRRRRRRRGGRREEGEAQDDAQAADAPEAEDGAEDEATEEAPVTAEEGEESPRRSRRGRRGGRRRRGEAGEESSTDEATATVEDAAIAPEPEATEAVEAAAEPEEAEAPKPKARRTRKPKAAKAEVEAVAEPAVIEPAAAPEEAPAPVPAPEATEAEAAPAKPKRTRRKKAEVAPEPAEVEAEAEAAPAPAAVVADGAVEAAAPAVEPETEEAQDGEPRRGWWQRTFGA
jgi:ribonuclease E